MLLEHGLGPAPFEGDNWEKESLKRADGKPGLQLNWNYIWMFRDGKWASQDLVAPENGAREVGAVSA